MSDVLDQIIELFQADGGPWNDEQKAHAERRWNELDAESKKFLAELSSEDLENICIGEYRDELRDDGTLVVMRLYRGEWQPIPSSVDSFLTAIWEF